MKEQAKRKNNIPIPKQEKPINRATIVPAEVGGLAKFIEV
jgi:hypothetical protein